MIDARSSELRDETQAGNEKIAERQNSYREEVRKRVCQALVMLLDAKHSKLRIVHVTMKSIDTTKQIAKLDAMPNVLAEYPVSANGTKLSTLLLRK